MTFFEFAGLLGRSPTYRVKDGHPPHTSGHSTRKGPGVIPLRCRWKKVPGGWRDMHVARQVPSGAGTIGEYDRLVAKLLAEGHAQPHKEARRRLR